MDIGHDSAFAGDDGVLLAAAVIGAFFFNVIVLNIIIAIYGHEYEKNETNTPMLFMMGRADYCVKAVLGSYVVPWKGPNCNRWFHVIAIATMFGGIALGVSRDYTDVFHMWCSAGLFAFGQTLLRVALIQCDWFSPEGQDSDDKQRFLWICHDRNWQTSQMEPHEQVMEKIDEKGESLE